jgi:hypothetical protein
MRPNGHCTEAWSNVDAVCRKILATRPIEDSAATGDALQVDCVYLALMKIEPEWRSKFGKANLVERRMKQVSAKSAEELELIRAISTDDAHWIEGC